VKFHSFRNALGGIFLALMGALVLNGCGGGGAAATTQGSVMRILPETGTVYAGVPVTFTVAGGRSPYALSSSEPGLLPVPQFLKGNTLNVVPANPGVVDVGLQPGELPVRTVTITARDATGLIGISTIKVGQNFLTAYGLSLTPSNCPVDIIVTVTTNPTACAGGTTAAQLQAVFNGNLHGNELFRLEVVRGNFALRHPVTGQVSNSVTLNSDHSGTVMALIEVPNGVPTQVAVVRVVHVATGVYADQAFVISGLPLPGTEALTAIPDTFTFTGATTAECGTGFGDFFVFGGLGPYTATSTNPSVFVTPSQSSTGKFTVAASNPTICVTDATIIVMDSTGRRALVKVSTAKGSESPPEPLPITIQPSSITLICNSSGSVGVVGGAGSLSATTTHPRVTATISGNVLTVTRLPTDAGIVYPTAATVTVTDGSQLATLSVTVPATCP
jgi:hypothetical protein